jgi:hypothetical protein
VLHLIVGLVFGAFVSLFASGGGMAGQQAGLLGGMFFGAGAIVVLPIFYGVLGFVMTLIGAALFNLVVGVTGGIEVEVA